MQTEESVAVGAGTHTRGANSPRARLRFPDPLLVFQIYAVLLIFSPSVYVVEPLGAAGTPATIFGCLIMVLWLIGRASGSRAHIGLTPLHWIVGIFAVAMLLAFCAGMLRPISGPEVSSSLRGLIALSSGIGVMLFMADSIRTRHKLDELLRFIVLVGSLLALMGVIQFIFGVNFSELLRLPWLVQNTDLSGVYERAGYPRVTGTAIHSIEFSAVIGTILPVAAHLAINATRHRILQWAEFAIMLIALPLAIARSGALALIIGLVFALVMANRRQRIGLVVVAALGAVVFRSAVPGLLGTIRSLFTSAGTDVSITGRVADLEAVGAFFSQSPILGRGVGTFVPGLYRTLDNQFLAMVVEAGLVGVIAFTLLLVGPAVTCAIAGLNTDDRYLRTQALAVATGLATATILSLTFDSFGFPMAFGMICLMLGASGAIWRVHQSESAQTPPAARRRPLAPARKLLVFTVIAAVFAVGGLAIQSSRGAYQTNETVILRVPQSGNTNVYNTKLDIPGVSEVMQFLMDSAQVRNKLAAIGVPEYSVAVAEGSLARYTDVVGHGDILRIAATADSEAAARGDAVRVRAEVEFQLAQLQADRGINPALAVVVDDPLSGPEVFQVPVNRVAAAGGALALAVLCGVILVPILTTTLPGEKQRRKQSEARP